MGSEILITGAAGFIGSHLAEALVARGADVVGVDSLDPAYDPAVKRDNLSGLEDSPRFTLETVDIRDQDALEAVVARTRPATIVHLAARAGVRRAAGLRRRQRPGHRQPPRGGPHLRGRARGVRLLVLRLRGRHHPSVP